MGPYPSTDNLSVLIAQKSQIMPLNVFCFQWNFTFNRFEVEPGQTYQVTVYHLPKLSVDGDYNCKSASLTMPGKRSSSFPRP